MLHKRKGIVLRKSNHHDRRVRRTQKLIRKAFLQLIEEKEYEQITVTDIIEKADYNRATFYRHYYDKEDLVNEIIDNQIELFIQAFVEPYYDQEVIEISELRKNQIVIFDHIMEHKEFYRLWHRLKTIPDFLSKYSNLMQTVFEKKIVVTRALGEDVDKDLYTQFYGYGLAGVIYSWIDKGFPESPDYMAKQLMIILQIKPGTSMLHPEARNHLKED